MDGVTQGACFPIFVAVVDHNRREIVGRVGCFSVLQLLFACRVEKPFEQMTGRFEFSVDAFLVAWPSKPFGAEAAIAILQAISVLLVASDKLLGFQILAVNGLAA